METFDKIIIGAGLYGLYSALRCGEAGQHILVLECDKEVFQRASYINQARVHQGYHYPRSLSTAIKSAHYFDRFCRDYGFCNFTEFEQVYATAAYFSWTNATAFKRFCKDAGIRCDDISTDKYFKPGMCDGAFLTTEYTYDAQVLKRWFLEQCSEIEGVSIVCNRRVDTIHQVGSVWRVTAGDIEAESPYILNAAYAGVNEIHNLLGFAPFKIKYEICEIILCKVNEVLKNVGITVMDGPFFSIMPFGKTGYHSLTSVTFTPHKTSWSDTACFPCQDMSGNLCTSERLYNCDLCPAKPQSAWPYMRQLARKFLREEYKFEYIRSHYSMKPVLTASEMDDSRPTVIRVLHEAPFFVSVLSGKINTVYDLDEVLQL